MPLKQYQAKRKFNQTPEPKGKIKKLALAKFVVQEHHASHLHWDFRLAMNGVLKSWAVPKGVPTKAGVKHLAIQVEDHPIDYINFRGTIPEGNYGAGVVKIWDKGEYKLKVQSPKLKVDDGELPKSFKFQLRGKKLQGDYAMINFKGKNWLIFKTNP